MNSEGLNSEVLDNNPPQAEVVAETPVVETPPPAPVPGLDDSSLYIHRELSQLQFNIRVLEKISRNFRRSSSG